MHQKRPLSLSLIHDIYRYFSNIRKFVDNFEFTPNLFSGRIRLFFNMFYPSDRLSNSAPCRSRDVENQIGGRQSKSRDTKHKGLLQNACKPCHSEPVVTLAWESVPICGVKRIATPVCGLVRNDRTAFCNRPLWSCYADLNCRLSCRFRDRQPGCRRINGRSAVQISECKTKARIFRCGLVELLGRFELPTSSLPMTRSTI